MAQFQILAYCRTAQIKISVFHSYIIAAVGIVLYRERRCRTFRKDVEFLNQNFNVSGRDIGILTLTFTDFADNLNAIFTSELASAPTQFTIVSFVEDELCDTISVA